MEPPHRLGLNPVLRTTKINCNDTIMALWCVYLFFKCLSSVSLFDIIFNKIVFTYKFL